MNFAKLWLSVSRFFKVAFATTLILWWGNAVMSIARSSTISYRLTYSGATLGNNATATGHVSFNGTVLPPGPVRLWNASAATLGVTDWSLNVTGAASGNGAFSLADLQLVPSQQNDWIWMLSEPINLTTELVGQDGFDDFNWCGSSASCGNPQAPGGTGVFRITTSGESGTSLMLISMAPVPEPSALMLVLCGLAAVTCRVFRTRHSRSKSIEDSQAVAPRESFNFRYLPRNRTPAMRSRLIRFTVLFTGMLCLNGCVKESMDGEQHQFAYQWWSSVVFLAIGAALTFASWLATRSADRHARTAWFGVILCPIFTVLIVASMLLHRIDVNEHGFYMRTGVLGTTEIDLNFKDVDQIRLISQAGQQRGPKAERRYFLECHRKSGSIERIHVNNGTYYAVGRKAMPLILEAARQHGVKVIDES
jgi:hypothetical protein